MSQHIEQVRKITSLVFGDWHAAAKTASVKIMTIAGVTHGYLSKQSQFGPYNLFIGDFIAQSAKGDLVQSTKLILPRFLEDTFAALLEPNKETGEVSPVEISLDIGAKPDTGPKPNKDGYVFWATPLRSESYHPPGLAILERHKRLELKDETAKTKTAKAL